MAMRLQSLLRRVRNSYRPPLNLQTPQRCRKASTAPPPFSPFASVVRVALGAAIGLPTGYFLYQKTHQRASGRDKGSKSVAEDVLVYTQHLRNEQSSSTFPGAYSHAVSLASNSPIEDAYATHTFSLGRSRPFVSWEIYDGHAGHSTSALLKENLWHHVRQSLVQLDLSAAEDPTTYQQRIKDAFVAFDDHITNTALRAVQAHPEFASPVAIAAMAPFEAGSCAIFSLLDVERHLLYTANVGDSRAVLGSQSASDPDAYVAQPLSIDQTGKNAEERARIDAEHPGEKDVLNPTSGRLLGLAVTRAFGDGRIKITSAKQQELHNKYWGHNPRPGSKTPPYLTAMPEVSITPVKTGDFVIMASDGLWDHMSSEDAVKCVEQWRRVAKEKSWTETLRGWQLSTVWHDMGALEFEDENFAIWRSEPHHFVYEDANAATCLLKNALGGTRRNLFRGVMTLPPNKTRYVRDDITIQVVFFGERSWKDSLAELFS